MLAQAAGREFRHMMLAQAAGREFRHMEAVALQQPQDTLKTQVMSLLEETDTLAAQARAVRLHLFGELPEPKDAAPPHHPGEDISYLLCILARMVSKARSDVTYTLNRLT